MSQSSADVRPDMVIRRNNAGAAARVAITLFDQAIVSGASFAAGMIVGKLTNKVEYGLYGLGFAVALVAAEFQSALVSTPQTVFGPRYHGERNRQFQGSMLLKLMLLAMVTSGFLASGSAIASSMGRADIARVLLALTAGVGAMHLWTFARVSCFSHLNPLGALLLDFTSCLLQLSLLIWLWHTDGLTAWTAWLCNNLSLLPSGIAWLVWFRGRASVSVAGVREDLSVTWQQSRWVLASSILWVAGIQVYPWLIEFFAGLESVAIWTACLQLSAVGNPLMVGVMNMLGPQIAHRHAVLSPPAFRRYLWRTMIAFALAMSVFAIAITLTGNWLMVHLLRPEYSGHTLIVAMLAFGLVSRVPGFVASRALFALDRADLELLNNIGPVVVLLLLGIVLTHEFGAAGAAFSLLVSQILGSATRIWFVGRYTRVDASVPVLPQAGPPVSVGAES